MSTRARPVGPSRIEPSHRLRALGDSGGDANSLVGLLAVWDPTWTKAYAHLRHHGIAAVPPPFRCPCCRKSQCRLESHTWFICRACGRSGGVRALRTAIETDPGAMRRMART